MWKKEKLKKIIIFTKKIKKIEGSNSSDNKELKLKYEEARENISKLEDFIKLQEERDNAKIRELENKLIQERLRFDQKSRDFTKIGW